MDFSSLYNSALEILTKAISHDMEGRAREALFLYEMGVEHLTRAISVDADNTRKMSVSKKREEYSERIKLLRTKVDALPVTPVLRTSGSTTPQPIPFTPQRSNSAEMKQPPVASTPPKNWVPSTPQRTSYSDLRPPTPDAARGRSKESLNTSISDAKPPEKQSIKRSQSPSRALGNLIRSFSKSNTRNSVDSTQLTDLIAQATAEEQHDPSRAIQTYKSLIDMLMKEREQIKHKSRDKELPSDKTKKVVINFHDDEVKIHERLGGGGSGAQIFRCTLRGVTFAAKVMHTADQSPEFIDGLKREIHIMEKLSHNNIVSYLAHDLTIPGEIRLYMEYFTNTLHSFLAKRGAFGPDPRKPLTTKEVSDSIIQIAKGLHYLHSLDPPIIHRDIKSENVFITLDPTGSIQTLKIGDFDISKLDVSKATFTLNMGTTGYMAPEVCNGKKGHGYYTAQADIWSLGMVMYELMEFEKPYFELNDWKKVEATKNGVKPKVSAENLTRYKKLIPIFEKLTEMEPEKRPTAKKVIKLLSVNE